MNLRKRLTDRRRWLTIVLAIAVPSAAGCGQGTCDIQGRVTYQGKPVVFGGVIVVDDQDKFVSARIDPEGRYVVTGVRTGTLRFAIVSPNPAAAIPPSSTKPEPKNGQESQSGARATPAATPGAAAPKADLKWQPLPKHYEDPRTAEITTVVTRGTNTFDIELK